MLIRKTFLLHDCDFTVLARVAEAQDRSVSYKVREIVQDWVFNHEAKANHDEMIANKITKS